MERKISTGTKTISVAKIDCARRLLAILLLALPVTLQGQFTCTTSNGAITITGYSGPGGDVTIPDKIHSVPVTSIGGMAFY